jgi:hypothetical protein
MFILNSFINNIDNLFIFSIFIMIVQSRMNFGKILMMMVYQKHRRKI